MSETHAIVLGGSLAGMCAAQVLRHFFDKVTILDRDACHAAAEGRPAVPQARHVHVLLQRGWIEYERLFPGFQGQMRAAGVRAIDLTNEMAILRTAGWQQRVATSLNAYLMTRDRLESIVRGLLRGSPNVALREQMDVTELVAAPRGPNGPRVTGVRAHSRLGGANRELFADLVVDATGRTSRAPEWLRALGVTPPEETVVDSFAGYSSRWFKAPAPSKWPRDWWWQGAWIDPAPPKQLLGGVLFPVEGDRWVVTLIGYGKQYPPTDVEGFSRALRDIRSPVIAESLALAEPISPVYSNRALSNRFRRYERSDERVDGFVAVGDSVCVFNPINGQGMTAAALCAAALEATLRKMSPRSPAFTGTFFRDQAKLLRDPWGLAIGSDFRFPDTAGDRPLSIPLFRVYTEALTNRMIDDPEIVLRATEVFYMLKPTSALLDPALVRRVALGSLKSALLRIAGERQITAMPPTYGP